MSVKFDAGKVLITILNAEQKQKAAIKMYASAGAKKFENYAKKKRKWKDRTGHARQGLKGWVDVNSHDVRINIGHSVDYGIWLELAHEQKYAILEQTVTAMSEEVLKGYENLLRYVIK